MKEHSQAVIDLDAFSASEKMAEVYDIIQTSEEDGHLATVFTFEYLGSTREAIFIVTLLRIKGYTVDWKTNEIFVRKGE